VLLTITTTRRPATDLGFLLFKHPGKAQAFPISAGTAHVFYPRANDGECTAALLVEIDPIALVRGGGTALTQYVNDRPYAAGSHLAVALRTVFGTAMTGRCDALPDLAAQAIPLRIHVPSLAASGGPELVRRLFEPLGWTVDAVAVQLDSEFPEWGDSRYVDLTLTGEIRLADALNHLYVLLPALDGAKHYWVSQDEADKLLRAGDGWLAEHPEHELITRRYLARQKSYVNYALAQLAESGELPDESEPLVTEVPERPEPLAVQRANGVLAVLRSADARRVLDLGCGGGALLRVLLTDPSFTEIVGLDVSTRALDTAERRLKLDRLPEQEHAVFSVARPHTVVVTTPNSEYNVRFEFLPEGTYRHSDHRFEWTRSQFGEWADRVAGEYGYQVRQLAVGPVDDDMGAPTQMAVFTSREEVSA